MCHRTAAAPKSEVARVKQPAPEFKATAVIDGAFKEIKLSDYTSQGKWVILSFFPMAWTFVCPTEIVAFGDAVKDFHEKDTVVIFGSTDSEYTLLSWNTTPRKQGGLGNVPLPLLSDKNHEISKAYGVYLEDAGVDLRGSFLIDPKGILRQITMNDLPVGRSVQEALRLVEAFQFTDKYGEVCPANWHPGGATIDPDVKGSKAYLEKANEGKS